MAKRMEKNTSQTTLIILKEEFKSLLIKQISIGKELYHTKIQTEPQLKESEKKFNMWDDFNSEILKSSFNNETNEYRRTYDNADSFIGVGDVMFGADIHHPEHRLKTLHERLEAKTIELESLLSRTDLLRSEIVDESKESIHFDELSDITVFIIHGHDEELKRSVQLFLQRGDLNDIVLHEQPSKNRTIIEKLTEEGEMAGYAIALLSPDDILKDGTFRARQNVILEIGYFIGKLGRERVKLLIRGEVEIPSDLHGILYEHYDEDGAWRIKLAKDMQAIGLKINMDKIIEKF